jgi:rhodanese-related sulfurtransferase
MVLIMNVIHQAKCALLLMAIASIPAVAQLAMYGFTPPTSNPFSITMEEVFKRSEPIVWVDARPEESFKEAHVSGALNLNRTNWDQMLPQFFGAFEPGKMVIVYCSPGCSESEEIASRIRNLGFDPVLFLEGGFESWKKATHSP